MNRFLKELELDDSNVITLDYFLKNYYGLRHKGLTKLKHKDLKTLNIEGIKSVPFDIVTRNDISSGEVLLVSDSSNNLAPYVNPQMGFDNRYETYSDKERRKK